MKVSEVITQLQKLQEEYGDNEFHIYLSYSRKTIERVQVFYDDELKDICIGVYG